MTRKSNPKSRADNTKSRHVLYAKIRCTSERAFSDTLVIERLAIDIDGDGDSISVIGECEERRDPEANGIRTSSLRLDVAFGVGDALIHGCVKGLRELPGLVLLGRLTIHKNGDVYAWGEGKDRYCRKWEKVCE
jgi:hypothetical protein